MRCRACLIIGVIRGMIVSLGILLIMATPAAYAQTLAGEGSDVQIVLSPASPAPYSVVNLSVESSIIDINDSTITWYEGNAVIAQGLGETETSITTGGLGVASDVSVDIQAPDGTTASNAVTIIPTEVDLLVDSDSYVPPFYRGRALPSAGTNLRLEAIAHLIRPDGSVVPSSEIIYTWKQDGRVVGNLSGVGKSSVILPSPTLYGTSDVEVDVASSDGSLSGSVSVVLPSTTPVLMLYEDNPLLGITYYHAIGNTISIPDTEMTFAAVPYFAQIQSPNDSRLKYTWTVNSSPIAANPTDPSEITLNAANSSGTADIGLQIGHTTNIFMDSVGQWAITLGNTGSTGFTTAAETKDPFTGQNP